MKLFCRICRFLALGFHLLAPAIIIFSGFSIFRTLGIDQFTSLKYAVLAFLINACLLEKAGTCPLTYAEKRFMEYSGERPYEGACLSHYFKTIVNKLRR